MVSQNVGRRQRPAANTLAYAAAPVGTKPKPGSNGEPLRVVSQPRRGGGSILRPDCLIRASARSPATYYTQKIRFEHYISIAGNGRTASETSVFTK